MTKVAFFYANGTASADPQVGMMADLTKLFVSLGVMPKSSIKPQIMPVVAGLHGITAAWPGMLAQNDPFCSLLDPNIFAPKKIGYQAAQFPMDASIDECVTKTVAAINNDLQPGQPFMVGGFSQGAAAMSSVLNEIRSGSLTSKASQFLGGVCFGNPRRQLNYRGSVGGTWSGTLYNPSATTGGHGAFPTTGPYPRLSGCDPTKWIEFTAPGDIFTSVGDSAKEVLWSQAAGAWVGLLRAQVPDLLNDVVGLAEAVGEIMVSGMFTAATVITDAVGDTYSADGGGHTVYPWLPPPGDPDNGLTSFQIAIKFLEAKAAEYATAPIVLPASPNTAALAGWTSALIPPAA